MRLLQRSISFLGRRRTSLLVSVLAVAILGCSPNSAISETPTPIPSTEEVSSPGSSDLLISDTNPEDYADPELGFSFRYADDWVINDPSATEGIVVEVASPDGQVIIDVLRDFPPPTIDLVSYAQAMAQTLQLSRPALRSVEEESVTLPDGTPAYRIAFRVEDGENPTLLGDLLVAIRSLDESTEAFIIQASGIEGPYTAWTGPILFLLETFQLDQVS